MSVDIKEDPQNSNVSNGNVGGIYGIFREDLHENITLVPGVDPIHQHLHLYPDDANFVITLDTASAKNGDRFNIKHEGAGNGTHYLEIKQGVTTLDKIWPRVIKEFIFDGEDWRGATLGTHPRDTYCGIGIGINADPHECSVAIGNYTDGHVDAVAIGHAAMGYAYGVAIGYNAEGHDRGVAIGEGAIGHHSGVALGRRCDTDGKLASIALGYRSKNTRLAELAINIGDEVEDDMADQLQQIVIGSWVRKTTDATPIAMAVNGNTIFTIRPQSALTFKIMVTARGDTSGDCAGYLFDGLIKRDGSDNTTLCASNKTVLHDDDDTWDCEIAAVGTRLAITVTGDGANLVRWAARLDGVETSFVAA